MSSTQIREGRALGFFAFDTADSIDLAAIPGVLRPERERFVSRRPAPGYLGWTVPPVALALGERSLPLRGGSARASSSARLFDFGAISLTLSLPLPGEIGALPALAEALAQSEVAGFARSVLDELLAEIRPALSGPGEAALVEDYWVFWLAALDPPLSAEALLADQRSAFAGVLALDAGPLSRQQADEVLREPLSYSPSDLVLADWAAALVCDTDCADTLAVMEFVNVQLLELRALDARLDRALARFSSEVHRVESLLGAWRTPHRPAIRALSELTVEALALAERVENALKLVPDVYLARVHRRCAARLGLAAWERGVESKLAAVRQLSTVLAERSAARRAETLEAAIVALIVLEIVLALAGWLRG